jgi:hypothetical protein
MLTTIFIGIADKSAVSEAVAEVQERVATFAAAGKKTSCLDEIEKLKINREERRKRMEDVKTTRAEREKKNAALGHKVDIEFQA